MSHTSDSLDFASSAKELSYLYYKSWNTGDLSIPDRIFAENFTIYDPCSLVPVLKGPEGVKGRIIDYRIAFPDLKIEVEDVITETNRVVTRWTLRGTHLGKFAGLQPSGKPIEVAGITIHRISSGRIVEAWVNWDTHSLNKQIQIK